MHLSICKFTQTFRGVLEELPNFLKLDTDRQNSTKSKLTGNPKPCYNEKIHPDKFIITMCLFSPNGNTASKKDVSASLQKRPFSLYQMRKTPILLRTCQPLLLLLRIQQLLRLHQPSGCCPCRSSPSFQRVPVQKKNLQTVRQSASAPWYRSYRKKPGLLPCYPGAGYDLYRRQMQQRSTSCQRQCIPSYKYLLPGAGIWSGWWSYQ